MNIRCVNNILTTPATFPSLQAQATLLLPRMVYMLTFITANTFLNIFAYVQDNEMRYQSSGITRAVVFILAFRKYFVFGVNWGTEELNLSEFAIFETDTHRGASETFSLLKY